MNAVGPIRMTSTGSAMPTMAVPQPGGLGVGVFEMLCGAFLLRRQPHALLLDPLRSLVRDRSDEGRRRDLQPAHQPLVEARGRKLRLQIGKPCRSHPLFGERLRPWQIAGLALGFAGVTAAVSSDLAGYGTAAGILAAVGGARRLSRRILYQKHFGDDMDLRTGMFIQLLAATVSIPFTAVSGGFALPLTFAAIGSVAWLALVGSITAFVLLFYILKRQPSASATSYLFLVPPATALAGVPILGQHLTPAAIVGFALAAIGVALVTRRPTDRRHLNPQCVGSLAGSSQS
ncbi:DMT family transporter [Amycolatopsis sp. NPDC026612]|uniref:DMT family transporter n=1 Tax=Amycolatopsis sp. NPDC026612 TaxID=3155466 RepID=UPI0034076168